MNSQGMVVKRFDAAASAAEREKKAAEEEERKKREAMSKEEGRRNRALLATYTNEKDIDQARGRALKENEVAVKDIETRIGALKKRQDDLKKELEFYQGKNKPPAKLEQDVKNAEFDIKTQQDLLAAKKKEVDLINARYDEDKKRYNELTKGNPRKWRDGIALIATCVSLRLGHCSGHSNAGAERTVYRSADANGKVSYSDRRSSERRPRVKNWMPANPGPPVTTPRCCARSPIGPSTRACSPSAASRCRS